MIGSVVVTAGIIKFCFYISNIYPYASRHLSLLLSVIFFFTFILADLYGEITSFNMATLGADGFYLLQSCIITRSRRYGIYLRFTVILLVILMISTPLIPYKTPRSHMMIRFVLCFAQYDIPFQIIPFIAVYIGLESSDSIDWSHLPLDLVRGIVN